MNYALIENDIVTNIIWLSPGNAHEFPNAVEFVDMAIQIGDSYIDGHFYRNGELILTEHEYAMILAKESLLEELDMAYQEGVNLI